VYDKQMSNIMVNKRNFKTEAYALHIAAICGLTETAITH